MKRSVLVLLLLALIQGLVNSTSIMPMEYLIPSNNWYSAPLFPKIKPSSEINYESMECGIIRSSFESLMERHEQIGKMSEEEKDKAEMSFYHCQELICESSFIRRKFGDENALTELFMILISQGKNLLPQNAHEVFVQLVDPTFRKFVRDISYPLIDLEDFEGPTEAVGNIIESVCGKRPREEDIGIAVVNRIYLDILVDKYIENAFVGEEFGILIAETNPDRIEELWKLAAGFRVREFCFDTERFYSLEERATVVRVRNTAEIMGIECTNVVSGSSSTTPTTTAETETATEFELGEINLGMGAPSGPSGGFGPAPGDPGSYSRRTGGAPGAPSRFPSGPPS